MAGPKSVKGGSRVADEVKPKTARARSGSPAAIKAVASKQVSAVGPSEAPTGTGAPAPSYGYLLQMNTAIGQIAHVNYLGKDRFWAIVFLIFFFSLFGLVIVEDVLKGGVLAPAPPPPGNVSSHFVFVLDRSGSMGGQSIRDLNKASGDFISARRTLNLQDRITFIQFDHEASVVGSAYQAIASASAPELHARGSTSYSDGLNLAVKEFQKRGTSDALAPVLVFMSDGGPNDAMSSREASFRTVANWRDSLPSSTPFSGHFIKFGSDSYGAAVLNDMSTRLVGDKASGAGKYHHAADGTELSKTFQSIAQASYDDVAIQVAATAAVQPLVLLPLAVSLLVFFVFIVAVRYAAQPILILSATSFPILFTAAATYGMYLATSYLSPYISLAVLAVGVLTVLYSIYSAIVASRLPAASLSVGASAVLNFPLMPFVQAALLIVWALYAKYALAALNPAILAEGGAGNIADTLFAVYEKAYYGAEILFTSGSVDTLIRDAMTPRQAFIVAHLLLTTYTLAAYNNLVVARLTAATFFDFTAHFRFGTASLVASVAEGGLGTAVIGGVIFSIIAVVDRILAVTEPKTTLAFGAAVVATLSTGFALLFPSFVPFLDIPFVKTAVIALFSISLPLSFAGYARRFLRSLADGANFFVLTVAGVTGESFISAGAHAISLALNHGIRIAKSHAYIVANMVYNRVLLPTVSIGISAALWRLLTGSFPWPQAGTNFTAFLLGSIISIFFLYLATDMLVNSSLAVSICIIMQQGADAKAEPGSPAAKRLRSKLEQHARSFVELDIVSAAATAPSAGAAGPEKKKGKGKGE